MGLRPSPQQSFVNVLPPNIELDRLLYEGAGQNVRVTDGSGWHLEIKEFGWV